MAMETVEVLSGFGRRLLWRLVTVGILASLLAGVAAYFIETERLDETLVDQAALEARPLSGLLTGKEDEADRDKTLQAFLQEHAGSSRDFFVLAETYDANRQSAGEAALADFAFVDAHFNRDRQRFPKLGDSWYTKAIVKGMAFLGKSLPSGQLPSDAPAWSALPLGVGTAIYLSEYTRETGLTRAIRFGTEAFGALGGFCAIEHLKFQDPIRPGEPVQLQLGYDPGPGRLSFQYRAGAVRKSSGVILFAR